MEFQLMKDFTKQKHAKVNGIQDKNSNCLTLEEIWNRWMEYCFHLYNYQNNMDSSAFSAWDSTNEAGRSRNSSQGAQEWEFSWN